MKKDNTEKENKRKIIPWIVGVSGVTLAGGIGGMIYLDLQKDQGSKSPTEIVSENPDDDFGVTATKTDSQTTEKTKEDDTKEEKISSESISTTEDSVTAQTDKTENQTVTTEDTKPVSSNTGKKENTSGNSQTTQGSVGGNTGNNSTENGSTGTTKPSNTTDVITPATEDKPPVTTETQTTECQHVWVQQYIHHDAVTRIDTWEENEIVGYHSFCRGCDLDLDEAFGTIDCEQVRDHLRSCHASYRELPVYNKVTKTEEITITPAWDEPAGYKCDICGAVKPQ